MTNRCSSLAFIPWLFLLLVLPVTVWSQDCDGVTGPFIFSEDFGSGTGPGDPLPPGTTTYTYGAVGGGNYSVTNTTGINRDRWHAAPDHTEGDVDGYALVFDASDDPGTFYRATFDSLCENTDYTFSCYVANVVRPFACEGNSIEPNLKFSLFDPTSSSTLGSVTTGSIPTTDTLTWNQYSISFRTRPGQREVLIEITNNAIGGCGNDLAIDDFRFSRCNPVRRQSFDLCELPGQMVVVGTDTLREPGEYNTFLDLPNTCNDSTIVTTLYATGRENVFEPISACVGEEVVIAGVPYTSDTTIVDTLATSGSCLSTITYDLTFTAASVTSLERVLCPGDSIYLADQWVSAAGTYRDTLVTSTGCDSIVTYDIATVDFTVDVAEVPEIVAIGDTVTLAAISSGSGAVDFTWSPEGIFDCPDCPEVRFTLLNATTIRLTGTDIESGCVDSVAYTIATEACGGSYFPTAFSPNGDGANDIYQPFLSDCTVQVLAFRVFDRWGALVHSQDETSGPEAQWDGSISGKAAPIGVYSYYVTYRLSNGSNKMHQGHLTLVR